MAGFKGVGVVFVRQRVRAAGPDAWAHVLKGLDETSRRQFEFCAATEWVPIELVTLASVVAAPILYPADHDPLQRLGRENARCDLGGVYAFVVRVMTVPFLIQQTARIWRTYHQAGDAISVPVEERHTELAVTGYPALPERFRHQMCGWLATAIEMTGAKEVTVAKSDVDPSRWTWSIRWR
jgi:hypothetical protein